MAIVTLECRKGLPAAASAVLRVAARSSAGDARPGVVTITTRGAGVSVGDHFYVAESAANFAIDYADWVLRLVAPELGPVRLEAKAMPPLWQYFS